MPAALSIRATGHLAPDEASQVRQLIDAARARDGVEAIGEHKFLRVTSGNAGGVRALLAYQDDRLVGYANMESFPIADGRRLAAELVVHPDARGHGIASRLLEDAIAEGRRQQADRVDMWAYRQLAGTSELAARFGFEPIRTLHFITMPLPDIVPEASLPEGVRLRTFEPGRDDQEWLTLNNGVFAGHPEQGNWDHADLEARFTAGWFDPADFLLATREGRMIAFNWLKLDRAARDGEIYVIGVHAEERRRGFGRALTLLGLGHMRARGMEHASAYVDGDNANAVAMYFALGFSIEHSDLCYSKPLG